MIHSASLLGPAAGARTESAKALGFAAPHPKPSDVIWDVANEDVCTLATFRDISRSRRVLRSAGECA